MSKIKLHIEKFSRGLKSRLGIISFVVVVVAMSSTFTFGGMYLYNRSRQGVVPKTNTSVATSEPSEISDSTTTKKQTATQTTKTSTTTTTTAPKTQATPEPVVVVQPVAPAPTSSVDSLSSATAPAAPVVSDSSGTSANPIRVSSTTYTSTNWSGYMATGGNFTTVSGLWVVPSVTGDAGTESGDSAWVGIGGVTSGDLIQAGTLHFVEADSTLMYGAFYEILPAAAMVVDMPISPGDSIRVSISETSVNQWFVSISDLTNGNTFVKNISYASSHSSAEWVEEDPSYASGGLVPFANFGTVTFSGCNATVDSYLYGIADIGASPITLVSHRRPVAVPSAISGTGFSVSRY
jgi:hypothetical protein